MDKPKQIFCEVCNCMEEANPWTGGCQFCIWEQEYIEEAAELARQEEEEQDLE